MLQLLCDATRGRYGITDRIPHAVLTLRDRLGLQSPLPQPPSPPPSSSHQSVRPFGLGHWKWGWERGKVLRAPLGMSGVPGAEGVPGPSSPGEMRVDLTTRHAGITGPTREWEAPLTPDTREVGTASGARGAGKAGLRFPVCGWSLDPSPLRPR